LAIFPDGYGAVIEPEGEKQLEVLPGLHARMAPFKNEPSLSASFAKLDAAETAFKAALTAEGLASDAVDTAFTLEGSARAPARAQLTSAHGRLRDLYKSRRARAEAFFMKLGRKEGKAKAPGTVEAPSTAEAAEAKGGATGSGATAGGDKPPGG